MKLYIVGPVGSGKSTYARRIAQKSGVPCCHLDEVVYMEDPMDSWGNRKRPEKERDALFQSVLRQKDYIMEDAGRACFLPGMEQADTILLLEPPLLVRQKRIVLRWVKQKIGVEKCIYKPQLGMLKAMFRWAKNYDTGADGTRSRIAPFRSKTVVLRSNKDLRRYLNDIASLSRIPAEK